MDYKITGDVMQALQITLRPGEELYAEAGSMLYMNSGIELQARMQGGVMKGLMRKFLAGESMFTRVSDAGKFALCALIARLRERGYVLFDTQVINPHTESLGAVEIPRADYLLRLRQAIKVAVTFG